MITAAPSSRLPTLRILWHRLQQLQCRLRDGSRRRCSAVRALASSEELPRIVYAVSAAAGHDAPGHAECAARIPAIISALDDAALTSAARPEQVRQIHNFRSATPAEVYAVHRQPYVELLRSIVASKAPATIESAPTYVTSSSYDDAFSAVGAALAVIDAVVEAAAINGGPVPAGFAICRPPGHHAIPKGPMGFCLFNTVAIAAKYAQQRHGLSRVMIFDFDVHHGNGTNDMFVEDPSVLFVSSHQSGSYPGTGRLTEVGKGDGEGATINLPLPGDSGDAAIRAVFEEVVVPAAERFQPDIILARCLCSCRQLASDGLPTVSAGYDAHWRDPLAGLQLRSATYNRLAKDIRALADRLSCGRVAFFLEGGYDLHALGESVADTFRGLLGEPSSDKFNSELLREEPLDAVKSLLQEARRVHGL